MRLSSPGNRGLANEALYHARILLQGCELMEEGRRVRSSDIHSAFVPAVRAQLLRAYGWFLLAAAGAPAELDPGALPRSVSQLPVPPKGQVRPPELSEFERLEHDGWLGRLLDAREGQVQRGESSRQVLASDQRSVTIRELHGWLEMLEALMRRMDDSLCEY